MVFRRDGRAVIWEPREDLDLPGAQRRLLDAAGDLSAAALLLVVQSRGGQDERAVPVPGSVTLEPAGDADASLVQLAFDGRVEVSRSLLLGLGGPEARLVVDLRTELDVLGWRSLRRVAAPSDWLGTPPGAGHSGPASLEAYATGKGNLSIKGPQSGDAPSRKSMLAKVRNRLSQSS